MDIDSLVAGFAPRELAQEDEAEGLQPDVRHCYAILGESRAVPETIIAAYANRTGYPRVRVLARQADSYRVVWSNPESWSLSGRQCSIERIAETGPAGEDWLLSLGQVRGSEEWVVRWVGGELQTLGPVRADGSTDLATVRVLDAVNSGTPQLLSGVQSTDIYARGTTSWRLERTVDFAVQFVQRGAAPFDNSGSFEVSRLSPNGYVLKLTNGYPGGLGRISDATVLLNGIPVASGVNLGPNVEYAEIELPVGSIAMGFNDVDITMRGRDGERLVVIIQERPAP